MRKKLVLLLGALLLTSCNFLNPGGYWTDQQAENMISFATQRFDEVEEIVNKYDGVVTRKSDGWKNRFIQCHYVHCNVIYFTIQDISYTLIIDLVPNEIDEPEVHEIHLSADSQTFANPDDCVFEEEQYAVMNDLLEYLDDYVSAKSFISLNQISDYMHVAKENYNDEKQGGTYEEKKIDKEDMVDFEGTFYYLKGSDSELYYNAFHLNFSKCPDKFK